jgi:hypothetical protein
VVVAILSRDDSLHVEAHFFEFSGEGFKAVDLVNNLLGELALGSVFDVSKEMLDTHLFGFGGTYCGWHMNELSTDVALGISFFLSEVCFSRQADLLLILDSDNNEDWVRIVSPEDLINLNITLLDIGTSRVPTQDLFARVDFTHHVEHLLVINVIEKPDAWLIFVFLKRNGIAIGDLKNAIIAILSHQGSNNSSLAVFGKSIVVIHNG